MLGLKPGARVAGLVVVILLILMLPLVVVPLVVVVVPLLLLLVLLLVLRFVLEVDTRRRSCSRPTHCRKYLRC